jgi:hypothetical protein
VGIVRLFIEKDVVWSKEINGFRGSSIEKISGGVKGFDPIGGRHMCLEQKSMNDVIGRANSSFNFAILGGSVRARKVIGDVVVSKERTKVSVDKIDTVVTLKTLDDHVKLVDNAGIELFYGGCDV